MPVTIDGTTGISGPASGLTDLNASNLSTGTVPDARFPATLPAASGANLTALNASNLGSGTVPDARFPATLPAASGANLTNLNASNLATGTIGKPRLPSGSVLQVQTVYKQDVFTTTATTPTDVTGLSVSITPSSATNKILVLMAISGGNTPNDAALYLLRNSTNIAVGTGGSSYNATGTFQGDAPNRYGIEQICATFLDSPATTSAVTYKIQIQCLNTGNTACINRRGENAAYGAASSIVLMEIVA